MSTLVNYTVLVKIIKKYCGRHCYLSISEQSLQINKCNNGTLCCQLGGIEQGSDEFINLSVVGVILIIV